MRIGGRAMGEFFDPMMVLGAIARRTEENAPHDDSDYVNPEDGLIYCGKCHTRKQHIITLPPMGEDGEEQTMKVPIMCECQKAEADKEEQRRKELEDMKLIHDLRTRSLMDARFRDQTFETFHATKDNERVLRLCKRYVDGFGSMVERNQGLLFWGDVGTGKTFAAACIANALLERRVPVVMTSFVKLLETMQGFKEDDEKLIQRLNRAKLLIIDDLGAERSTEFALEKVYNIIDSRYRAKLPMVLTTNLKLDEMKQNGDIRYSRIYDRIFEVCYPVQFKGQSFRKQEANRRFREMKDFLEG